MAPRRQATAPAPTVRVQRPSSETQREGGSQQAEKPNTGQIAKWLQQHGVPVSNNRQVKPKKSKDPNSKPQTITASNVTTLELETHFRWSFQNIVRDEEDLLESAIDSGISEVMNGIRKLLNSGFTSQSGALEKNIGTMISLPSEWKEETGSMPSDGGEAYWRQALMMFLRIYDSNHEYVNFLPKEKIKAATYPDPNIFHMYNEKYRGGGIAWTLTNTLGSPTFGQPPDTEMDVERLVSSFLNGYLNVSDCETTSNAQLKFRDEITCFGSHPHPDFATRIKRGLIAESRLRSDLYPVVGCAEAKRDPKKKDRVNIQPGLLEVPESEVDSAGFQFPTDKPLNNPERLPMAAQLAFAVYPSLVIIIASLITQWQSRAKGKRLDRAEYGIPEWAVVYGIGYAGNGILIYAFFPRVIEWDENNFPTKWGFMSLLASTGFINAFRNDIEARFNATRILLMIQQHSNRLKDHIKSKAFRLPEEFLD